jgi:BRCA2, oligonucleotide/oligosaccharide-binding, domain 3
VSRQEGATLHLTAGRSAQFLDIGGTDTVTDLPSEVERCLVKIGGIGGESFRPAFNEVDLVGWVLSVGEPKTADFQSVYICDRKGF